MQTLSLVLKPFVHYCCYFLAEKENIVCTGISVFVKK